MKNLRSKMKNLKSKMRRRRKIFMGQNQCWKNNVLFNVFCCAGQINECSAEEYKLSEPETGEGTGTKPFQEMTMDEKCSYSLYNRCVMASLLMLLHTASDKSLCLKSLFESDSLFKSIMESFKKKNFFEAQMLWLNGLSFYQVDHEGRSIDCWSRVKNHFPRIDCFVSAKAQYKQKLQCEEYKTTLMEFHKYGDVKILRNSSDPDVVLIHRDLQDDWYNDCLKTELPDTIMDKKNRIFKLQSFLLGKGDHMQMMNLELGGKWQLYDDYEKVPNQTYPDNLKDLNKFIYLACYIIECPAVECHQSVPETMEGIGPKVFAAPQNVNTPLSSNSDPRYDASGKNLYLKKQE